MSQNSIIANRLKKNFKKMKSWLQNNNITAYRLYEKDIPEFPFIIDRYNDFFVVYERGASVSKGEVDEKTRLKHINQVISALKDIFSIEEENIIFKRRLIKEEKQQYEKEGEQGKKLIVNEYDFKFLVNLTDYLDTGLFLDHRPLRQIITNKHKIQKVLNLFCYTGSLSIAAAKTNAQVTSVDLSKTYIQWAKENFKENNLTVSDHQFINSDVFTFLKDDNNYYDLIILDPPSFSNSKKFYGTLDVQRDHKALISLCSKRITRGGELYFSTNLRGFKLDADVKKHFDIQDITDITFDSDIRDHKLHQCFYFKRPLS